MTFRRFAFNNVMRNKRLYAAYFLSSMFTVMVFFTFAIFAFHPALAGKEMNVSVQRGMNISAGIIYVFSFFFVRYSMSSFLNTRKREFGLLMIQGMSVRQIRLMVFMENRVIGFFATMGGILLGLIFSKGILLIGENVLVMALNFYIPIRALIVTFVSFILLFLFISIFVSYVLRSRKLIDLIKGNKKSKGEPKANIFLTSVAVFLIGIGYGAALIVKGTIVIAAMLPVIVVVIIGTYLLFTQLSVYMIRRLKKNDNIFWRKTNMILLSDLSFRMKDNARTFFMVAIVSTVAFSAIGTLFGFQSFYMAGVKNNNPFTFSYRNVDQKDQDIAFINETIRKEKMKANHGQMELTHFEIGQDSILIARESDFNRFAMLLGEATIDIQNGQVKVVEFTGNQFGQTEELLQQSIELDTGVTLNPDKVIYSRALPATDSYYVVSDQDFEALPAPKIEESYHAWQVTDGEENIIAASKKIAEVLPPYEFFATDYTIHQLNQQYGLLRATGTVLVALRSQQNRPCGFLRTKIIKLLISFVFYRKYLLEQSINVRYYNKKANDKGLYISVWYSGKKDYAAWLR